jgi:hypothetical protein
VVAAGLTACVPPLAERVYELPSEPVTLTWVASVAVMVSMDELPGAMAVGSAVIVTVGGGFAVTVTVAVAVADPPAPVAVAVYVVVAVGLTAWVPPVAGRVKELPSDPATETWVALVALIVSVDELPDPIEEGLAVMLTIGGGLAATVTVAVADTFPDTPVAVAVYVVVLAGVTACVPPVELS